MLLVALLGAAAFLVVGTVVPVRWTVEGVSAAAPVQPVALATQGVFVAADGFLTGDVRVQVDGAAQTTVGEDGGVRWTAQEIAEGTHELRVRVARRLLPDREHTVRFAVDATPPAISAPATIGPLGIDDPVVITGTAEPGSAVAAVDTSTVAGPDGSFTLQLPAGVDSPVTVVATDAAGNTAPATVLVQVVHPPTRGIHVSFDAWNDQEFRRTLFQLIDERRIDTVQLDLKDETGLVGFATTNAVANEIGAVDPGYDLAAAVQAIHERGARVVGRIVAFRDPVLAEAMWEKGNRDWVLQTPDGEMLGAYGGFSNYTHPDVRDYNLDLAEEAARLGVDDILWDYIRRPEGDPATMVVPGRGDTPSTEWIASFLEEGLARLRPLGTYQGASVFGISASRPDSIAQNVPMMAQHLDYVAPMLYPSHWNPGEYGVDDPNRQPYDIVKVSLEDFQRVLEPTGTPLVLWVQDFDDGVPYGVAEVQAQIRAAADVGVQSWLLWNSGSRYTLDALEPLG